MRYLFPALALVAGVLLSACAAFDPPGQLETGETADGGTNFQYGAEASISPFHQEAPQFSGLTGVRMLYPITIKGDDGKPKVLLDENGKAVYIVAEWISGKEADNAIVEVVTPDGNVVSYNASGLRGFEGQALQAQLRESLAQTAGETWTELGEQAQGLILNGICLGVLKTPCS